MSTRSEIAIENKDGSISSVYCHSDGYIEHNGCCLNKYYNSHDLALSIINQNDCSYLGETIEDSRFYNSWRNENTKSKKYNNEACFMQDFNNDIFAEYIYLFKNNKWYVSALKMLNNPNDNYSHCISYHNKFTLLDDLIKENQ